MSVFTPYDQKYNRKPDFTVDYEYIHDQSDYVMKMSQGMRSDFCYEEDAKNGPSHMIWPEFLDNNGNVILDTETPIPDQGKAHMWVIVDEKRDYHRKRLCLGMKGYLMVGSHRIANVVVTDIAKKSTE